MKSPTITEIEQALTRKDREYARAALKEGHVVAQPGSSEIAYRYAEGVVEYYSWRNPNIPWVRSNSPYIDSWDQLADYPWLILGIDITEEELKNWKRVK